MRGDSCRESHPSCIFPVLAYSFSDVLDSIEYSCCNLTNYYLPNHSFNLFNFFQKCVPCSRHSSGSSSGVEQRCAGCPASMQWKCRTSTKGYILYVCVCLSVRLVVTLEGVQVGFEAQGADVGEVGRPVEVQARQDLHVSDSGRMKLQQVFDPLRLILGILQRHRQLKRTALDRKWLLDTIITVLM